MFGPVYSPAGQPSALTLAATATTAATAATATTATTAGQPSALLTLCEGWWLSSCCGSVAKHWRLKPEVSWVQLLATAGFFTFLLHEARCSEHLVSLLRLEKKR